MAAGAVLRRPGDLRSAILLLKALQELWHFVLHVPEATESDVILGVLTLIDLTLTGSLIIIVIFSGYENFVSKIDADDAQGLARLDGQDRLHGAQAEAHVVDRRDLGDPGPEGLHEPQEHFRSRPDVVVGIHMVFVVSGVILALTDRSPRAATAEPADEGHSASGL